MFPILRLITWRNKEIYPQSLQGAQKKPSTTQGYYKAKLLPKPQALILQVLPIIPHSTVCIDSFRNLQKRRLMAHEQPRYEIEAAWDLSKSRYLATREAPIANLGFWQAAALCRPQGHKRPICTNIHIYHAQCVGWSHVRHSNIPQSEAIIWCTHTAAGLVSSGRRRAARQNGVLSPR